MQPLILHHLADSRSQRLLWLLEELGLEYTIKHYPRTKDGTAPRELLAIHPLGKSPVLEDPNVGEVMAETGYIIDRLLDLYDGESRFRPKRDEATAAVARREYDYLMHYAEGTLMTPLVIRLLLETIKAKTPLVVYPVIWAVDRQVTSSWLRPTTEANLGMLEAKLQRTKAGSNSSDSPDSSDSPWFVEGKLSGADFMLSFPLEACPRAKLDMSAYPRIMAFVKACHARPAYRRALEKGGAYAYGPTD